MLSDKERAVGTKSGYLIVYILAIRNIFRT